jgi:predicted Zn finger-like uncharacterized protein
MIVTCHNCSTRLQLDPAKVPSRAFSVRCPKCQQIVNAQPPTPPAQRDAMAAVGDVPASTRTQQEATASPPPAAFMRDEPAQADGKDDVLRLLAAVLRREAGVAPASFCVRPEGGTSPTAASASRCAGSCGACALMSCWHFGQRTLKARAGTLVSSSWSRVVQF